MAAADARLEARELTCIRDRRTLFQGLDFALEPGQVLQLEGANGSGKTSLMRILCGLALPTEGGVFWRGQDIDRYRAEYHRELLYLGHNPGIKLELTPLENLRFFQAMGDFGRDHPDQESLWAALDEVGLFGFEDSPVRSLSAGQRRRVALARLWLSDAKLWVLDEPFTAIDRIGVRNLEARIARHAVHGGLTLITTHQAMRLEGCEVRSIGL